VNSKNTLERNLGYERRQKEPGLVTFYDIRPRNGAGLFFQPRSPYGPYFIWQNHIKTTHVDGEVLVWKEEESLEAVIEAVKLRVGVDEKHPSGSGGTGQVTYGRHRVQYEAVAQGARSDGQVRRVETGLTQTRRHTEHPTGVQHATRLHQPHYTVLYDYWMPNNDNKNNFIWKPTTQPNGC